jgi:hypothetical protein
VKDHIAQLCIGPVHFVFGQHDISRVRYTEWPYKDFFYAGVEQKDLGACVKLEVFLRQGKPDVPDTRPDYVAGRNWAFWRKGERMCFGSGFQGGEGPQFYCELSADMTTCDLYVAKNQEGMPLRYPLDQIMTWGALSQCTGVLLHAAAVEKDGVGYVLAGRSGAGKSTLSGICQEQGWRVLNDDRVIVYRDDSGVWQVAGTPWPGSGAYAQNQTFPLGGLYTLIQDAYDKCVTIDSREAQFLLLDVTAIAWFSKSWSEAALDSLYRLCADIQVGRLHFTRSAGAAKCLEHEVAA